MGVFENWKGSIPTLDKVLGIVMLILNILFPGLGTLLCSFLGGNFVADQLLVALLQFLTVPIFLVGWIWSIYWGVLIYQKAK